MSPQTQPLTSPACFWYAFSTFASALGPSNCGCAVAGMVRPHTIFVIFDTMLSCTAQADTCTQLLLLTLSQVIMSAERPGCAGVRL